MGGWIAAADPALAANPLNGRAGNAAEATSALVKSLRFMVFTWGRTLPVSRGKSRNVASFCQITDVTQSVHGKDSTRRVGELPNLDTGIAPPVFFVKPPGNRVLLNHKKMRLTKTRSGDPCLSICNQRGGNAGASGAGRREKLIQLVRLHDAKAQKPGLVLCKANTSKQRLQARRKPGFRAQGQKSRRYMFGMGLVPGIMPEPGKSGDVISCRRAQGHEQKAVGRTRRAVIQKAKPSARVSPPSPEASSRDTVNGAGTKSALSGKPANR